MTPSACPLCHRPKCDGSTVTDAATCRTGVAIVGITGALADCHTRALLIAALAAPVVAAACALMAPDGDYDEAALCNSVTAYRAGLRRLGAL